MKIFPFFASIAILVTALFSSELRFTPEEEAYLQKKKVIKMCIDPHWMPFESFDADGRYIGMTSDYFKGFEKELGIPIKVVKTKSWTESIEAAKSRKCDIYSLAMETPERKEYMNFTTPYLNIPLVLATRMNIAFMDDMRYLKREKIGIVKGYAFNELIRKKYPNIDVVDVKNVNDGLQKVANGELFGFIGTIASIGYALQRDFVGELKIAGKFPERWELGIGVRNDAPLLYTIFEKLVREIPPLEKQKILNKYISVRYEKGHDYQLLIKVLVVVFIVALFGLYHYRKLSKINAELHVLKDALQEQANHDPMTNLYNRRYFYTIANDILNLAHREQKSVSIIMLDIDYFKKINDMYGHAVGDIVIKRLASIMLKNTRKSDVVARIGGEEFAILLPNTNTEGAKKIASKIRELVNDEKIEVDGVISFNFTVSLGVATATQEDEQIDSVLNRADKALYKAKEAGRNKVSVFES